MYKIWIDEAWRWPWAWPVVACSLCFNPKKLPSKEFLQTLNDSKKLSEKKREEIFEKIIEFSNETIPQIYFWVWVVDNFIIDEINIRQANKKAMGRSLIELYRKLNIPLENKKTEIFIDWKDNYVFEDFWVKPSFIIRWDSKILEISAASIIAKVFRDKLMDTYSLIYPSLWFEKHKWYWTKKHIEAILKKDKITWIHRISYKPIKNILEN